MRQDIRDNCQAMLATGAKVRNVRRIGNGRRGSRGVYLIKTTKRTLLVHLVPDADFGDACSFAPLARPKSRSRRVSAKLWRGGKRATVYDAKARRFVQVKGSAKIYAFNKRKKTCRKSKSK